MASSTSEPSPVQPRHSFQPPSQYVMNHLHDYGMFSSRARPCRPSMDLHKHFAGAVAYAQTSFAARGRVHSEHIPTLVIRFANHRSHPYILGGGDEEGVVHFWNTNARSHVPVKRLKVSSSAIFDMKFVPEDPNLRFIAAAGNLSLSLVDMQREEELGVFHGHFASVKCLDFQKDTGGNVFASGGRDGHVMIWDTRSGVHGGSHHPVGYLVNTHKPSKKGQRKNLRTSYRLAPRNCSVNVAKLQNIYRDNQAINRDSVTDIIFQDQYKFFTSGTGDCSIKCWDMRKMDTGQPRPFYTIQSPSDSSLYPFTSLCLDSTRTSLFATSMDRIVYEFDIGPNITQTPVAQYVGALLNSFYVKCSLSCNDEILSCGSTDGNAYLFKVREPEAAPVKLQGHTSEVMSVAFNHMDALQAATHGDDDKVMVWYAEPYVDRSNPQNIIGKAVVDSRELTERTPTRTPRARMSVTRQSSATAVSDWVKKRPTQENDRTPSPVGRPSPSIVLRTPNRDMTQRKKRLKELTLSPFFRVRRPADNSEAG